MTESKLEPAFRGIRYFSPASVMMHAERISREIKPSLPQKPSSKVSKFTLQVAAIAPRFLDGQYKPRKITQAMLQAEGRIVDRKTFERTRKRVASAIRTAKQLKLIPVTTPKDKPTQLPKLREATGEAISKHLHLVDQVLDKGHFFFRYKWGRFLDRNEARSHGIAGLVRGIETYDETKGKPEFHMLNHIAARVSRAVKQEAKRKSKEISLDSQRVDIKTLHEYFGQPAIDPAMVRDNLEQLMRIPKIKSHHLMAYVLHNVYGHTFLDIGQHFQVSADTIRKVDKKAKMALRQGTELTIITYTSPTRALPRPKGLGFTGTRVLIGEV